MSTAVVGMRLSLDYPSRSCTSWRPNVTSPALPSSCRAPSGMKCQTWTTSWTCGGSVDHNTGYRSPTTKCLSNSIRVDMIFLRPITSQVKGNAANIFLHSFNPSPIPCRSKCSEGCQWRSCMPTTSTRTSTAPMVKEVECVVLQLLPIVK